MSNALDQKFTLPTLLKFTAPTMLMMVVISFYTMVDGVFVANFVNQNALSAINIVYPAISIIVAIAIMLAAGGSAIISAKMGMGEARRAKEDFSLLVIVAAILGVLLLVIAQLFTDPILHLLGTNEVLYPYALPYFKILFWFAPFSMLQMLFQFFFVTAGKPSLGLGVTLMGGAINILLDYFFIVVLKMGIEGAAIATGIGSCVPALFGLFWFFTNRKGTLCFVKPKWDGPLLWKSCSNGSSEMVTNMATAVTTLLFNLITLKYLGVDGVAAITIILYTQFFLIALYLGFSSGIAPAFGFQYGKGDQKELKKLFLLSSKFVLVSSAGVFLFALFAASPLVLIFVSRDSAVYALAKHGFLLFSINYLFAGFNLFTSSLFTALSNGKISALLSFLRTFLLLVTAILLLPSLFGIEGIWLAVPVAEALSLGVSTYFLLKKRKDYGYL